MDDVSQMNKGVQILLERMSSNPNEFIPTVHGYYPKKWQDILLAVQMRAEGGKDYKDQLPFLNDKEVKALWEKMQSLQGELFTKRVMNTLLRDAEEDNFLYANTAHSTTTLPNGGTVNLYPTIATPLPTYAELAEVIDNLSPIQKEELSSLSRQVTGGSPRTKL